MRVKSQNGVHAFDSKVKGEQVHITVFQLRRKAGTFVIDIEPYLAQDTEYQRRQYLFNKDVSYVKSQCHGDVVAEMHLDAIQRSVTYTLKEAGQFRMPFAETVRMRAEERKKLAGV